MQVQVHYSLKKKRESESRDKADMLSTIMSYLRPPGVITSELWHAILSPSLTASTFNGPLCMHSVAGLWWYRFTRGQCGAADQVHPNSGDNSPHTLSLPEIKVSALASLSPSPALFLMQNTDGNVLRGRCCLWHL